jgi:hypothetical protein
LPYGTNALTNDMAQGALDANVEPDVNPEDEQYVPQTDEEQFLFGPTDRPDEPLTTGMSFGPGANITSAQIKDESTQQFTARIANTLRTEGENSPGLKKFLDKAERGL